jgi:ribosomal protein L11 methyltransferase
VLRIGRRLVVRPPWRRVRPRQDEVVITVDPGAAFGTGQHPTTRLCLEALEERIEAGATVLDVGCGSGILAIAAALLGAWTVDAVDIDEGAVRATAENAARNGVDGRVRSAHGSLGARWPFVDAPQERYDLVLANLNARALQELAGELVAALRPAGTLVASGVIEEYEDACVAAFERARGRVEAVRRREEWRALLVRRAEHAS